MGTNVDIIKQLKAGNPSAFDYLYAKFSRKAFNVAFFILKHEEDSLEVVQETFLKIWLKRAEIDTEKSLEGYLSVIARNFALKLLKKRLSETFFEEIPELISQESSDQDLLKTELQNRINQEIEQLSPKTREVFILSRKEGLSNSEIAARLNLSLSTVNNHIYMALTRLRSNLQVPVFFLFFLLG